MDPNNPTNPVDPQAPIDPVTPAAPGTPADESFIKDIRHKSFREIAEEERQAQIKADAGPVVDQAAEDAKKEQAEKEKLEAEQKAKDDEVLKLKEKEADVDRKIQEAVQKEREEAQKKLDAEQKAIEDKKKLDDKLTPSWLKDPNAPIDPKTGKPVPRSYEELAEESARIGEERAIARIRAEQAEAERVRTEQTEAQKQAAADQARIEQEDNERMNQEIKSDLDDLYSTNKLPKVLDENNPNDPGIIERRKLFETGIKINQERAAKGLPPIKSIKLVYYEHYKAATPPPGTTTPVGANSAPTIQETNEEEYNWARDHKKSPRQLLMEEKQRIKKRLGLAK